MKELIKKLSMGTVEYSMPDLELSILEIEHTIEAGRAENGEFCIFGFRKDMSGKNCPAAVKGMIYSTNDKVEIQNPEFFGEQNLISYTVHGENIVEQTVIKGKFCIVSNSGETSIPYEITIEASGVETSIGNVSDLFQFANLVQMDYEEAVKLFQLPSFPRVFLEKDIHLHTAYDGLMQQNYNIHQVIEEFLIYANKKKRLTLSLKEEQKKLINLTESYGDIIEISKDGWGYIEVDIETDGDFITVSHTHLTSEDFVGGHYEYSYLVNEKKLHQGVNYGKITFRTISQILTFLITVEQEKLEQRPDLERKSEIVLLTNLYIEFRMHRYEVDEWMKHSLAEIEKIRSISDKDPFIRLIQAQVCLTKGEDEEASWLLEQVADEILDCKEEYIETYCYYLYVRTLEKRDAEFTMQAFETIRTYYESGYDNWKILWVLLYLDESYDLNQSLKLARIKEQYYKGCSSPLMYYEALEIFNEQPGLLRILDEFELQVLYFGAKREYITERLARQTAGLAMFEKNFRPLLFNSLTTIYTMYEDSKVLEAICSILIKSSKTDSMYFECFEVAVRSDISLTRLYEYYMYSVDLTKKIQIPEKLLRYFIYNNTLSYERMSYLYASLIWNKDKNTDNYWRYRDKMEQFAMEQIEQGHMNEFLAQIYREVLNPELIQRTMARSLPSILRTFELTCTNDNITEVIVLHKEIQEEQVCILNKNKAYVKIYTEKPVLVFVDRKGRRYIGSIDYGLKQLLSLEEYMEYCYEWCPDNKYLYLYFSEKFLKYHKNPEKSALILKKLMELQEIRSSYKKMITEDVIDYYYHNYDGDMLDEYLKGLHLQELKTGTRIKVVELMIVRGLYEEAYKAFKQYGNEGEGSRRIAKFCTRILGQRGMEYDPMLLGLCIYAFRKGKYDETILEYLSNYFYGSSKEMLTIWSACKDFDYDSPVLEEKLMVQMLFTRMQSDGLIRVFQSYYEKGMPRMLKYAFMVWEAHNFFVKGKMIENEIFQYFEKEIEENDDVPDICEVAYLKYMSMQKMLTEKQKELCQTLIQYMCKRKIFFEFYKKFQQWFPLPYRVLETTVVEYRIEPGADVRIHYIVETGMLEQKDYTTEEMQCFFGGVYVKYFTLFYGENILYYISEKSDGKEYVTESENLYMTRRELLEDDSRYGLLNDMMICKDLKDETTLKELAGTYMVRKRLAESLFEIL